MLDSLLLVLLYNFFELLLPPNARFSSQLNAYTHDS